MSLRQREKVQELLRQELVIKNYLQQSSYGNSFSDGPPSPVVITKVSYTILIVCENKNII